MTALLSRFPFLRALAGAGYCLLLGVFAAALFGPSLIAQETKPTERVYNCSQRDVEKALEDLKAYDVGRLPVLAGFVNAKANTLKDYGNPHYQFQIEVIGQGSDHTLVQVSAKITAWYTAADAARSQYALIPSSGRLEEDLLDRLSVFLGSGNNQQPPEAAPLAAATGQATMSSKPSPSTQLINLMPPGPSSGPVPAHEDAVAPPPNLRSPEPAKLAAEIAAAKSELEAVEQKERRSQNQIAEFESVGHSRQHIADYAIPKKAQTPVFSLASEVSKVLFYADAEDEFEVFEAREGWVHVRLENDAQGWLRIPELELPGDRDVPDELDAKNFSAANEVIQTFTGEWPVLKGKSALFVLAQPKDAISRDILGNSQLEFATHTFVEGYRAATHSQQTIDGVVVVFMGEKPGVAAATLPEIQRWQEGKVSDKLFFDRCSFDPPDSFRDASKR
jgi:hypothetical protein